LTELRITLPVGANDLICCSITDILTSYVTALSVLPAEVVTPCQVPIEDLLRSSSEDEGLLPEAISEALGISLAEVLDCYFREDSDASMQDCLVGNAIGDVGWLRRVRIG
jgi:hypothetical protein